MTTQQTFETLVDRVSVATDKLETAVTAVELGTGEMTVLVERAEQAEAGAIAASEIALEAADDAIAAKNIILNTPLLPEAPEDGKQYARSNANWVEVVASGGGEGTVQSVNEILPDAEGNITLTPANIGAANASHTHLSTQISDSTTIGRNVLKATTEALARGAIGAGTSDLAIGTTATTAAAGNHTHNMATVSNNGFMAASDKVKLNAIETEATKGANWNTNVTNKPTIPTNTNQLTNGAGFITEAPDDSKEYVRKSKGWVEATGGGGGDTQVKFLHPAFENGWEYNFGPTATPDWQPVDYYPDDSYHAIGMLKFRRRGAPHAGGTNSLPNTGQEGDPIVWNQMFSTAGYIQAVPPGKYWFHTNSFTNSVGGAALYNKTGYIIVHGAASSAGLKRAEAIAFDTTTNIPSVYYWKADGTWNKAV